MEAIRSSETSVLIRATRRHLPEDDNHRFNYFFNFLTTFFQHQGLCSIKGETVNDELESFWKEAAMIYFNVFSHILLQEVE
jgi:hypothetical protein